ncbi:hypothetical protein [Sinomonas flava]|uniref:Uncharacterized protein n=1 Tax=Sinomonas flava TaxID=496857 RepID=A0ABP5NQT5_9MICC
MSSETVGVGHAAEPSALAGLDLSGTVTNLSRVRAKNRARLANSDLTRAFLEAGLALTDHAFTGSREAEGARQILSYVSRPRIVARAQADCPDLAPTEAKFRDRWAGQQDFLDDFVSYALVSRGVTLESAIDRWAEDLAAADGDVAGVVRRIADESVELFLDLPSYRLQLLTVTSAAADTVLAGAAAGLYAALGEAWHGLLERFLGPRGLRLRPGLTAEQVAALIQAVGEGAGLRLLAGIGYRAHDGEGPGALLASALLGLLLGAIDDGGGLSLDDAVDARFGR